MASFGSLDGLNFDVSTTNTSVPSMISSGGTSAESSDHSGEYSDEHLSHDTYSSNGQQHKSYREKTQAWWSVGDQENGKTSALTHQSAGLSLLAPQSRVFANQKDELWDLSDSLMELYEHTEIENLNASVQLKRKEKDLDMNVDPKEWLQKDTTNGFIRVYAPESHITSQLVPVTLVTSAHKVCLTLGLSLNALHVQMNGDIIRRLDMYEHPLVLQNEYLAGLGYADINRIQEEGIKEELGYLIRFYAGKPYHDSTFSRNQLQGLLYVRKGKVLHQWMRKLCVLTGTRLLIYKGENKKSKPTVVQLAKGSVEEVSVKDREYCIRVTSTMQGERSIYLSFNDDRQFTKWFRKCKKATDKLPTSADLSNCHLEFLPETIFINDQLSMLNLRHNVIKERPIEEDIYTIGWIEDLPRFTCLRSLNLADNQLTTFPQPLCEIRTLVELNLASNRIDEIPPEIAELTNLQALHLHNNHLSSLPDELVALRKLFILVLAFNHFTVLPPVVAYMTDVRISEVENIIMTGNQIEKLSPDIIERMKYAKKVDFRLNQLTLPPGETMKFNQMEHLTHLDIRDNLVYDLDLRAVKTLEYLNCERNELETLQVNGTALKSIFASRNKISKFNISPKPEWLLQIDVSRNRLCSLPGWVKECFFLQKISASHNLLTFLPEGLFVDAKKLKSLRVDHNQLTLLPEDVEPMPLEEIHIHYNKLTRLPHEFFSKAVKLRVLNASKNRLTTLPPVNDNEDLNKLHELYLTSNNLTDDCFHVISGFPRLKILHLAHNELHEIPDNNLARLEMLQELNVSGNQLLNLPSSANYLSKLVILRAHSNMLQSLPDFKEAKSLRVLDVGHNQLLNVSVTSLMASQLSLLDMSLNSKLKVDPREFKNVQNSKSVCLVDLTGQDRKLPGLDMAKNIIDEEEDMDPSLPWKAGFSETSGMRNKLCVKNLKILKFGNENEALFAMCDGGRNNEVPLLLHRELPGIVKEEMSHEKTGEKYLKYAVLSAHRQLKASGQRLGASLALLHVRRMLTQQMNYYTLQLANVGDVEAVLCRQGEALPITKQFTTTNREEGLRIRKLDGIITEDNKVSGTTKNTRLIGCNYLYPHVIPDPYTTSIPLRHDDEFIIVANRGLWKFVSYIEAVEEIYDIGNPVVASKKLQDLAQGYGSKENIGIMVIRLNTDSRPSLWRLRQNRSMSIDDFQAAEEYTINRNKPHLAESTPVSTIQASRRDTTPPSKRLVMPASGSVPSPVLALSSSAPSLELASPSLVEFDVDDLVREGEPDDSEEAPADAGGLDSCDDGVEESDDDQLQDQSLQDDLGRQGEPDVPDSAEPTDAGYSGVDSCYDGVEDSDDDQLQDQPLEELPDLRPLPNQRFRKKNPAPEWEAILQKRLTSEVKDREMQLSINQIVGDDDREMDSGVGSHSWKSGREASLSASSHDASLRQSKTNSTVSIKSRGITPPWVTNMNRTDPAVKTANPIYSSYSVQPSNDAVLQMTAQNKPKVRNKIAMFENLSPEPVQQRGFMQSRSKSPGRKDNLVVGAEISFSNSQPSRPLNSQQYQAKRHSKGYAPLPPQSSGHSTIIQIQGGTVTASTTDRTLPHHPGQSYRADMVKPGQIISRPREQSYYTKTEMPSKQSDSDDSIAIIEISRL